MYQPVALIASLSPTKFLRIPSHLIPNSVSITSCSIWLTVKGLGWRQKAPDPLLKSLSRTAAAVSLSAWILKGQTHNSNCVGFCTRCDHQVVENKRPPWVRVLQKIWMDRKHRYNGNAKTQAFFQSHRVPAHRHLLPSYVPLCFASSWFSLYQAPLGVSTIHSTIHLVMRHLHLLLIQGIQFKSEHCGIHNSN